ncbi:MAG TPA: hypothetical protein PK566_07300 [Pseudobacteroides sp.]|nr:hypothetical protein [Pseudobacteroides sp.]
MKKYYVLDSNPYDYDHIMRIGIPADFNLDRRALYFGEMQYIDLRQEVLVLVKRNEELPDIYNYDLPLISHRMKEVFDDIGVDNVYYKPILLVENKDSYFEYYIPFVRVIDCVKWEKSEYREKTGGLKDIEGAFEIDDQKVGNYKIFKIEDALSEIWVINQELKEALENMGIKGAKIVETTSYER